MGDYLSWSWFGRPRVSTCRGGTSNSFRFGASKSNHLFEPAWSWIYVGLTVGILLGGNGWERDNAMSSFERGPVWNSRPSLAAVQGLAGRGIGGVKGASGNE